MSLLNHNKVLSVAIVLIIVLAIGLNSQARAADRTKEDQAKAEAVFDEAREALNRGKYEDAAQRFQQAYQLAKPELLAGDALYWEAFSRYRLAKTSQLKQAAELLYLQQQEYATSATAAEGEDLAARVYAQLAERGEADAAREITARASEEEMRQETRAAALQALMHMDPKRAMPMLKKIVMDDSPENKELRSNAVFIMCQQGGEESEDMMIDLLQKEQDPEFLSQIVMCLSMTGSEKGLQALMEVFRTTNDTEVAEAVLFSVGRHGGEEVFNFLVEIAKDTSRDPEVRSQSLMALTMTGRDHDVARMLIDMLENENDPELLEMALVSLSRVDDPAASQAIMQIVTKPGVNDEFRAMALHFATMNGDIDLNMLRDLYRTADSRELKEQICHVLTRVQDQDQDQALDLLIEIARTETDPEIKRDAVFWIGQFDNDKAAQFLLDVITEK